MYRNAQEKMNGTSKVYIPNSENHKIYKKLYKLYRQLHDRFGLKDQNISMYNVMKDPLDLRDKVRRNL